MKSILFLWFLIVLFFTETSVFSQARRASQPSQARIRTANELKLNLATTFLLTPEIIYERVKSADDVGFVKSDYFGYGFSVGVSFPGFTIGSNPEINYHPTIYDHKYHILSYCRFYFNRRNNFLYHYNMKRPQLFFIEPSAAVVGFDKRSEFCLGLSLGMKLINIMNCTGEIYVGGGNNLKRHDSAYYYRFGINP